jgi:hypothetical protein
MYSQIGGYGLRPQSIVPNLLVFRPLRATGSTELLFVDIVVFDYIKLNRDIASVIIMKVAAIIGS